MQLSRSIAPSSQLSPLVLVGALLASIALGTLITLSPWTAVALLALAGFVLTGLQDPGYVPLFLLAGLLAQPLVLRMVPESFEYWLWIKRADEFVVVLLLPIALLRLLIQRRWPLPTGATVGAFVLLVIGVIGAVMRSTPFTVAGLDAFLLFKGLSFFVIVSAFVPSLSLLSLGFAALLVTGIGIGLFGIAEVLLPDAIRSALPLVTSGYRGGMVCLVSIFEGEGQAGWFFAFLGVVCFAFYSVTRRQPALYAFFFSCACSLLTLRRKPVGGILFMLLVYAFLAHRGERKRGMAILLLVVLVAGVGFGDTIVGLFVDGYEQYVGTTDPMRVARNAMYVTSFQLAKDNLPIGVGFGLFGGFSSRLYYSPVYFEYGLSRTWGLSPDNPKFLLDAFWPHIVGEFGFLGLIAFVVVIASIWLPLCRAFKTTPDTRLKVLTLVAVLALAEALVESTAESIFESTLPCFLLFGVAAIAHRHQLLYRQESASDRA